MRSLLFLCCLCGALPMGAHAQLVSRDSAIVRGQPVTITLPQPAPDTLIVEYRPNAVLARQVPLPTGGASTVVWTPDAAGVVRLIAGDVRQNVSVRYVTPPISGIIVLLLAATILFGGAIYALRKLFQA